MKIIFKIFILLFIYLFMFTQNALAETVHKVTSFNYDTSNSFIMLTIPDSEVYDEANGLKNIDSIKIVKMENPTRAYFDIPSAILTMPKQDWEFSSNGLKQVVVSQFSTNPNIVRVVMYFDDDFDVSKFHFFKIKNNIIIKFKDTTPKNEYFQNSYRDDHASSSDFYEYLTMTTTTEPVQVEIANEIQEAFKAQNISKKELKLNTKYFIDRITAKPDAVLLNGFGSITIEKPMILTNPSRIVYDIPNTLVKSEIRNTEYKIGETDTVKIGQFSVNKARIVITTNNVEKYIPIISCDNQSLLIANSDKLDKFTLFSNISNMIAYSKEKTDTHTNSMILAFTNPIVHSVARTNNHLNIFLYNVENYNENDFLATYKGTAFEKAEITLLPKVGIVLTLPLEPNCLVNTYLGADGKAFKIEIKKSKMQDETTKREPRPEFKIPILMPKPTGHGTKKVVIDAGHGGSDYGAIREDINEKDITIDIAKQVRDMLVKKGYQVQMTREEDEYVSLQDRVAISEQFEPEIFVSIHVNSSTGSEATGVETHYYHQESLFLAQTVHASVASAINTKNRGLFKSKFYVINHTTAPAILIEIGFLSNPEERAELTKNSRRKATAKAIVEGVENYFKQLK